MEHNAKKGRLIMMVGVTKSGNSTYAAEFFPNAPRVSLNALRLSLFSKLGCSRGEQKTVMIVAKAMVRALFIAGHDTVVLDAMNTKKSHREDWKNTDVWLRSFYVMPCDEAMSLQRLERAAGPSPDRYHRSLIDHLPQIVKNYQVPTMAELDPGEQLIMVP